MMSNYHQKNILNLLERYRVIIKNKLYNLINLKIIMLLRNIRLRKNIKVERNIRNIIKKKIIILMFINNNLHLLVIELVFNFNKIIMALNLLKEIRSWHSNLWKKGRNKRQDSALILRTDTINMWFRKENTIRTVEWLIRKM